MNKQKEIQNILREIVAYARESGITWSSLDEAEYLLASVDEDGEIETAYLPDGTKVVAVESRGCAGCILDGKEKECLDFKPPCEHYNRKDGRDVIWVRAE